jgi:hypothetical protein
MFEKDDKRRLYWLMDQYLSGNIDERTFCDEYYYSYDLEIDYGTFTDLEQKAFSELSFVSSRFSEFTEDLEKHPGVYFSEEKLRQKIQETQEKLKSEGLV